MKKQFYLILKQIITGLVITSSLSVGYISAHAQCSITLTPIVTNVTCYNGTNGSISVTASGGSAPYQYQLAEAGAGAWSNVNSFTGLVANTYPLSVRDNTGCIKTIYLTVTQPAQFVVNYVATDVTCTGGSNGSITSTVLGGTPPYTYSWTKNGVSFSTAANLTGLLPGNYALIVTDNAGCTTTPIISQQIKPIGLTGFNEDVVANGSNASPASVTSQAFDDGNGNVLYENGYTNASGTAQTPGGLPNGGSFASAQSASRVYQLASYTGSNSLLLRSASATTYGGAVSGTLSFQSQYRGTYSTLYVLASTGSGTGTVNYTVNYSDATTATGQLTFPDWYLVGSSTQSAIILKRVARPDGTYDTRYNFNLFEVPITISGTDQSKVINSVSFTWANAGSARVNLMAITGYTSTTAGIRINDGSSATVAPAVSISSDAISNTFCGGQNVTFTALPVNGGTTPSYQWKKNGVNVGTNSVSYSSNALNNNDLITVVLTSNLTCVSPATATSNTLTMINGTATAAVSIASSPGTNICSGNTVSFTATPTNGGVTPSYQWKLNNLNVGSNAPTYNNSSLNNGDSVKVIMTSSIGCALSNPATSNALRITVTPTVTPTVTVTASPPHPFLNNPVTFTATTAYGGASPIYQWYDNGTAIPGQVSPTLFIANVTAGHSYSVKLTSNYTCVSSSMVMSNYISTTGILPITLEWYTARPENGKAILNWKTALELNNRQFIVDRAKSTSSTDFINVGSVPANNAPNGSVYTLTDDPGQAGIYLYRLTQEDIDGVRKSLGIRSVNLNGKYSWMLEDLGTYWQLSSNQYFNWRLMDVQGKLLSSASGNGTVFINKPDPAGIYLLQVETGGELFTRKLKK